MQFVKALDQQGYCFNYDLKKISKLGIQKWKGGNSCWFSNTPNKRDRDFIKIKA